MCASVRGWLKNRFPAGSAVEDALRRHHHDLRDFCVMAPPGGLPNGAITRPDHTAARADFRLPRCVGQCRADGVLAGRLALLVRVRPIRRPHTGVPVCCRQLSVSGPVSTTLYPIESMNWATAVFASAESPAIGR